MNKKIIRIMQRDLLEKEVGIFLFFVNKLEINLSSL